jgi:long-chain fatty acid transport protein
MTKLCPTLGFSFRPYPGLSVDASCMYVAGVSRTGSYPTKIDENTGEVLSKFEGRYTTTAWSPSIGISYKF